MPVLKRFGPFPFKKTGRRGTGAVTLNNFAAAPIGPYENWGRERLGEGPFWEWFPHPHPRFFYSPTSPAETRA